MIAPPNFNKKEPRQVGLNGALFRFLSFGVKLENKQKWHIDAFPLVVKNASHTSMFKIDSTR